MALEPAWFRSQGASMITGWPLQCAETDMTLGLVFQRMLRFFPPEMRAGESALREMTPFSRAAEPCWTKCLEDLYFVTLQIFTLKEQNSTKHMAGDGKLEERRIVFTTVSCS